MRALRRIAATGLAGGVLTLSLAGCPLIVGLDSDYAAGPGTSPDGSPVGPDGSPLGDGGGGGPDAVTTGDATHPKDGSDAHVVGTDGGHLPDGAQADSTLPDSTTPLDSSHPTDVITGKDTGDACPATCSVTPPSGWSLVAFDVSNTHNCPATGFVQTTVATATGSGSCSCGSCTVSPPQNCANGSVTSTKNATVGATTCTAAGNLYSGNGGLCSSGGIVTPPTYSSFQPSPPASGSCSATATPTDPMVDFGALCQPTSGCATSVCGLAGFKTCIYQAGMQTCPGGYTQHSVGSSVTTQCGACSCSAGAPTCTGTFDIYAGAGCSGGLRVSVPLGACTKLTNVVNGDSYMYNVTTQPDCNPGTASAANMVNDPATICCN